MTHALAAPLAPFVDALPVPRRLVAAEHEGRLTVRIRAAAHRFHRDLPESRIWGYDGTLPGPTIEAERGHPVTVEWRNELGLPEGGPFEVPLLLQDRNFDLDDGGRLTGRLLHKTDTEVMEAFPPFTVVNGKVWPALDVQPDRYRFRVINGSNARTFRLVLLCDGEPQLDRITQIGTDHGLLHTPVRVPPDGLVLASAERADVLVDFSGLGPGSELTLLNTASSPFDGSPFPAVNAEHAADPDSLLPYPQVMRFRVVPGQVTGRPLPGTLATDFAPPTPTDLASASRRAIALVERELDDEPNMLTMRELAPAGDDHTGPLVTVTDGDQITRYRVVAANFEDTTTFFPVLGGHEVWQLINLTDDTHPIHLHLDPFQILTRRPARHDHELTVVGDRDLTAAITLERDPDDDLDHAIDANERGLKDTVRVNPNEIVEIVEIAVRFTTYSGRYMYHCHILEHEDRDMMRPFVTTPAELMPFMS